MRAIIHATYRACYLALALAFLLLCSGCAPAADTCERVPPEELSAEAAAVFETLSGKHGVMVYNDAAQQTRSQVCLYAVLYGPSGQELELEAKSGELIMKITGEAEAGYAVWRVTYKRDIFASREVFFQENGETKTMDGVETNMDFVVEKSRE